MMKRSALLVWLFIPFILAAQATFSPGDLNTIANRERDANEWKIKPHSPEINSNYDVKWYRCRWNIDPQVREISGDVTILFTAAAPGADSVVIDLSQDLSVDSVTYHSLAVPLDHSSGLVSVRFPSIIPAMTIDSVSVFYHGVPPDNGFGSFTQSTHNGSPVIWTLSEPYGSSDWWPCKNGLTDKADSIDIFIRTPSAYKAASNGVLVSATQDGISTIYHWKHRYPIAPYLVCLAVTNYASYWHSVPFGDDTLGVVNYVYPEDSASVATQTGAIVPMIQVYDSLFGIYPFQAEKYGHVEFGWGGGMEHQTMTFVSSFGFELLAHELAHQWFGDKVTCGTWTDIWLNEGFATYLSGLCYEHLLPDWWRRFREVRVKSIVSKPGGSVYCTDTTSVARIFDSRLSYAKGAMILHQLRWILGDQVFFSALNDYLSDPALSYGFARTADLKVHLESASGTDLTSYFNDWFTGEGFPSYKISWNQQGAAVIFTVGQTQSHPSVAFFRMPVPVQFKNATRDTIVRVLNTFSGQSFTVTIPFKVDSVLFDPDYQIISGNNTVDAVAEPVAREAPAVYPNPATGKVTFSFGDIPLKTGACLRLYDQSGRLQAEFPVSHGLTQFSFSTDGLPPGSYNYLFETNHGRFGGKLVIAGR